MSTTPVMSNDVATGRWMKGSEMFTEIGRQDPALAGFAGADGFTWEPTCNLY
jgi:hypothetical protein